MKFSKKAHIGKRTLRKMVHEDYRYLQKRVSGRSVYKGVIAAYRRIPKHRKRYINTPLQYER